MLIERRSVQGYPVTVIHLDRYAEECGMCGATGFHRHAVPYYCGPTLPGCSDGGYKTVCASCYSAWDRWADSFYYFGA